MAWQPPKLWPRRQWQRLLPKLDSSLLGQWGARPEEGFLRLRWLGPLELADSVQLSLVWEAVLVLLLQVLYLAFLPGLLRRRWFLSCRLHQWCQPLPCQSRLWV